VHYRPTLQSGRRTSILPKAQLVLRLPGGPYTEAQLQALAEATEGGGGGGSDGLGAAEGSAAEGNGRLHHALKDAWEMAGIETGAQKIAFEMALEVSP
jgi:hypothetical protein